MKGALVAAGLAGAFFGLFAAAGLTWLDAGELGAAAWELGIAHPPGFPVFTQLHGLVMHLVPFGDAAFRGALASGLFGAGAVGCLVAAARWLDVRPLPAVLGALAMATSGLFTLHAVTIEVYSGAACWVAAVLWLGLRLRALGDGRDALGLGLLVGLAAGHHAELRLFVVLAAPAALIAGWRRPRALALVAGFAVLGALCLAYLPLRSAAEPWRDWGNPETLGALWDHFWGRSIRAAYGAELGHLKPADVGTFLGQLWTASPALLVLGLSGLVLALRRPGGRWLALVWLVDLGYAVAINPMGLRDLQNGVPGLCALGLGAAVALDAASRLPAGRVALPAAALALVAALSPMTWVAVRGDRVAGRLIRAAGDEAPAEALAFVVSDGVAAGFAFAQVVEGLRPDLAVIVRQHVARVSSVGPVARRLPAATAGWQRGAGVGDFTAVAAGWPVRWEWAEGADAAGRPADLAPRFPWFATGVGADVDFLARLDALAAEASPDPQTGRALASVAGDLGRWALGRSPALAVAGMARAAELQPDSSARWTNLGQALVAVGRVADARAAAERALALAPDDRVTRLNMARMDVNAGAVEQAGARLDALLADDPADADALGLRGVLRANAGDLAGAADDWRRALEVDPAQVEARVGLARLRRP
ncbi:MAG: DUF2723 domain-containing protein [Myxococcales bacterium]|nr:DUF2723 domain-containing protein [Myxococcales bacterium]